MIPLSVGPCNRIRTPPASGARGFQRALLIRLAEAPARRVAWMPEAHVENRDGGELPRLNAEVERLSGLLSEEQRKIAALRRELEALRLAVAAEAKSARRPPIPLSLLPPAERPGA